MSISFLKRLWEMSPQKFKKEYGQVLPEKSESIKVESTDMNNMALTLGDSVKSSKGIGVIVALRSNKEGDVEELVIKLQDGSQFECKAKEVKRVDKKAMIYSEIPELGSYSTEDQQDIRNVAQALGKVSDHAWDELDAIDRDDIEKNWEKYKELIQKEFIGGDINPTVYLLLEEENQHSLNKALVELGKFKDLQIKPVSSVNRLLKKSEDKKGRPLGSYAKGEPITQISQVKVGDKLIHDSKQFNAINVCEVIDVPNTEIHPGDIFYAKFVLIDSDGSEELENNRFAIWDWELEDGEYFKAVKEGKPEEKPKWEDKKISGDKKAAGPTQPKPTNPPPENMKWIWDETTQNWITVPVDTETVEVKKEQALNYKDAKEDIWYERKPKEVELPTQVPVATDAIREVYSNIQKSWSDLEKIKAALKELDAKYEKEKMKIIDKSKQSEIDTAYKGYKEELTNLLTQATEKVYSVAGHIVAVFKKVKSGEYKPTDKDKLAAVLAKFPEATKYLDEAMVQLVKEKSKPSTETTELVDFPDVTTSLLVKEGGVVDALKGLIDGLKAFIGGIGEAGEGLEGLGEVEPALASKKTGKQIGSQNRETLEEAGYEIYKKLEDGQVVLKDKDSGNLELFTLRDDFAGWVVEIDGRGYEFVSSYEESALTGKKLAFAMGDTVVYKAGTPEEEEGMVTGYVGKTVDVKFNLSGKTINISPELLILKGKESKKVSKKKSSRRIKMAVDTSEIGDGKLPNKYWVQGSSYFLYASEPGIYDWVDDKISGTKVEDYGVFNTYREARAKAEEVISSEFSDKPVKGGINRVTIEDRISGEVFSHCFYATKSEPGIMGEGGWTYEAETQEDLSFTKKKMEEAGQPFDGGEEKEESLKQSAVVQQFTGEELRKYWGSGEVISFNNKKYTVGRMSYGDYFLQPESWKGGETEGHSPDTLWLVKVDPKKDIYEVESMEREESLKDFGLKVGGENPHLFVRKVRESDVLSEENIKRIATEGFNQNLKVTYDSPDPYYDGMYDYTIDEVEDQLGRDMTEEEIDKFNSIVEKVYDELKGKVTSGLKVKADGQEPLKEPIVATAEDIILVGENDQNLYNQRFIPIYKNLTLKKNRGVYDSALAPKLFKYWVDDAAKLWYDANVSYYDDGTPVMKPTKEVKEEAAQEMAKRFEQDYEDKAYDFMEDQTQRSFRPKKVKEEPKIEESK